MFLTPPEFCDVCCSINVVFNNNTYTCLDCKASVGCHTGTNSPFGRMANGDVRRLRVKAHDALDAFWKKGLMTRDKAYDWLSRELNIERSMCHIALLNSEQLTLTITASQRYYIEYFEILNKRKVKKRAKDERSRIRTYGCICARKSK